MELPTGNYKFTKFDKYILKEFIKSYLGALLLIVILINVTELVEKMGLYQEKNVSRADILLYYIYKTPYLIFQYSSIAVLFAVVFSLGILAKNRELMSIITGGVNFLRMVFYLYITGLALSIFLILFNDIVCSKTQEQIGKMNRQFKGITHRYDKQNIIMYGKENYIYYITYYHFHDKKMDNIQILKTSPGKEMIEHRIDSRHAQWDSNKKIWVFHDGIIRFFEPDGSLKSVERFKEKEIALKEEPVDFEYQKKYLDELSISASWKHIKNMEAKGFMARKEWVDFHIKFSLPFSCLLMIMIGAPLSIYSTRSVLIISFGLTLSGYVLYWLLLSIGMSLGKNGVLSPFLSVWITNFVFIIIIFFIHKKVIT